MLFDTQHFSYYSFSVREYAYLHEEEGSSNFIYQGRNKETYMLILILQSTTMWCSMNTIPVVLGKDLIHLQIF